MNNIFIVFLVRAFIRIFLLLFSILLLMTSSHLYADGTIYSTDDDDNLETIVQRKMKLTNASLSHYEVIKSQILKFNPHVKDWNKIPEDYKIFLASPLHPHITSNQQSYLLKGCALNRKHFKTHNDYLECIKKKKITNNYKYNYKNSFKSYKKIKNISEGGGSENKLTIFGFYALSSGTQVETTSARGTSELSQNSLYTLGAGGSYLLESKNQIVSSLYIAKYNTIDDSLGNETLPPEIGANLYYQFNTKITSPYLGLDYEKITTLNYDALIYSQQINSATNNVTYLTAGFAKVFYPFDHFLLLKISASFIGMSHSSTANALTGQKFIIFGALGITKNFSTSFFYKRHDLTDVTKITIQRYGLGFNYTLF